MNLGIETELSIEAYLGSVGQVERTFGERHDSRTRIYLVRWDTDLVVVKHAEDREAIGWLKNAEEFHGAIKHPAIPTVLGTIRTAAGFAIVEEYALGSVLVDQFDPDVLPREHPDSAYQRFLSLPVRELVDAISQLIDAHVTVAEAAYVAVDLYDGCLVYDFDRRTLRLIDLDTYREGPYVLDVDRQFGSTSVMAPEEFLRGATIDQRTTVYTLGRIGLICLGAPRHGQASRHRWRGTDNLFAVLTKATQLEPPVRFQSVADLRNAWEAAAVET